MICWRLSYTNGLNIMNLAINVKITASSRNIIDSVTSEIGTLRRFCNRGFYPWAGSISAAAGARPALLLRT